MNIPTPLLNSLDGAEGFNKEAFEEAHNSAERLTSIRINPSKINDAQALPDVPIVKEANGVVPWCPYGYYVEQRPFFTFDPLFHGGAYYVQEASSMFLWEVLKQTVGNGLSAKVLDLCAAPGGKTTLLASYFTDGWIVANEVIKSRVTVLTENITKWGSDHVVVTNNDPEHFQRLENYFDAIIVDAPCSGSGLFRKDPEAVHEWSEENVHLCSLRQRRILANVLPALKQNGILVYSTCSYSRQENEDISDWIMNEQNCSSLRIGLQENWGIVETLSPMHGAYGYRFYPDKVKGEGFFVTAFQKRQEMGELRIKEQELIFPSKQELQMIRSFLPLLPLPYKVFKQNDCFRAVKEAWVKDLQLLASHLYIKKAGIELGSIKGKDFIPSHELALSLLPLENIPVIDLDKEDALQYLRKKEIRTSAPGRLSAPGGWNLVAYCGLRMGWVKVLPNRINNYYPADWRILKD